MSNLPLNPVEENALAVRLMTLYQKDDGDAFTQLYGLYQRRLLWFVSRSLANREDVECVSQNVWCRIHRTSRFNFRLDGSFYPWLLSQARSELSMYVSRRDPVLTSINEVSESELKAPEDQNFYSLIEPVESREQLKTAIDTLPAIYRAVVVLRYFDGKSTKECAELLGIPEGTVGSRLSKAIQMLRTILGQ